MNLKRFVVLLAVVPALILLGTGCGGIRASQSVSPLNFILPGLMDNGKPEERNAPVAANPQVDQVQSVAQAL